MQLILASASPRRADLLRAAGYEFDIVPVDIDETVRRGESPVEYVERLAHEKAAKVLTLLATPGVVALGADTAVVLGEQILGKPHDAEDAARMLRLLSGRTHEVLTGLCLCSATTSVSHVEGTNVTFSLLSDDEIAWHTATGEWHDKAGGYAIQGFASRFTLRIDGSYPNVVGLPIGRLDELLHKLASAAPRLASGE